MNRTATGIAGGVDRTVTQQSDTITEQLDSSAGRDGIATTGVYFSAAYDISTAANQADHAAGVIDALCTNDAFVIDDIRKDVFRRATGQQYLATVCLNLARVADGGVKHSRVLKDFAGDLEEQQASAVEIERCATASSQRHLAQLGHNQALVADAITHKRNRTARGSLQQATVDDDARASISQCLEVVITRHKIVVFDIERTRDQCSDVYGCRLAENDAVGINQEHHPVRIDGTEDLARILIEDAIQRDRSGTGLVEDDALIRRDVECLPFQQQSLRHLIDRGRGPVLPYRAITTDDFSAGWAGPNQLAGGSQE